jgi:hypothetical protein
MNVMKICVMLNMRIAHIQFNDITNITAKQKILLEAMKGRFWQ